MERSSESIEVTIVSDKTIDASETTSVVYLVAGTIINWCLWSKDLFIVIVVVCRFTYLYWFYK